MAGQFLIKWIILCEVMVARGQSTESGPCWDSTIYPDDVLAVCRLDVDLTKTRHGIGFAKETKWLLVCGWKDERCPKCSSDYGVHPLGNLTNVLIVRVPADQSQDADSYKYQLVPPPDGIDPYNECEVIRIKAGLQVTQQITTDARASTARTCVDGNADDVFGLIVTAIVLLSVILAAIFAIGIFLYCKFNKFMRRT